MKLKWKITPKEEFLICRASQYVFNSLGLRFWIIRWGGRYYETTLGDNRSWVWKEAYNTLKAAKKGCEDLLNEMKEGLPK